MNAPTLAALMLVAVAAWSGYTVVNYAERHIWASNDAWVLKVCWGAYVLSWLPIVLLPFEVMNADLTGPHTGPGRPHWHRPGPRARGFAPARAPPIIPA